MSDNSNVSPWKNPALWGRVVTVLLFLLLFGLIVGPLAIILGVVQAGFTIVTGEDNRNLRDLSAALAEYIQEILLFATWNREQRPFPFSEFPRLAEAEDSATGGEEESPAAPEQAADVGKKVCPECEHVFRGKGWGGLDAHWKARHEHLMPYEEAGPLIMAGAYRSDGKGEPE